MKKFATLALFGASLLSAKTYTFTVTTPSQAGSVQLKPGEYKLKVDGSQAVLMDGRGHQLNATTKVETTDHKFNQTSILSSTTDGTNRINWVELGGSKDKVDFE
jgi:hypothetical protein